MEKFLAVAHVLGLMLIEGGSASRPVSTVPPLAVSPETASK